MTKEQIIEALRRLPVGDRLEVIQAGLQLLEDDLRELEQLQVEVSELKYVLTQAQTTQSHPAQPVSNYNARRTQGQWPAASDNAPSRDEDDGGDDGQGSTRLRKL
jgi:hypothetical protein